jgi:hypothetical protein
VSGIERVPQLTEAALKSMSPEQIVAAYQDGSCAELLGRPVPVRLAPGSTQLTEAEAAQLTPEQRTEAYQAGRLAGLLGRPVSEPGAG